jgi:hypothetical protein
LGLPVADGLPHALPVGYRGCGRLKKSPFTVAMEYRKEPEMRTKILLLVLTGYLFFNQGFMQIRLPPGSGVPIGEIALIGFLAMTNIWVVLTRMRAVVHLLPFVIWWSLGIGRAVFDSGSYGMWALRDATQVIESLYLIVGVGFVRGSADLDRLFRWLAWLVPVLALYVILGHPLKFAAMSPTLPGGSGEPVPLFGTMNTADVALIWGAMCLIVAAPRSGISLASFMVAAGFVAYAVLILQYRTIYLQLVAMFVFTALFRKYSIRPFLAVVPIVIVVIMLISTFGLKVSGRLNDEVSLSFFADHLEAIFGISNGSDQALADAASGVDQRLEWWKDIYDRLSVDPATMLTGLGYGIPLTPFKASGDIQVREPHNSVISVVARMGVIGLLAWAWMQCELFLCWFRCFQRARHSSPGREWENRLLILLSFLLLVMIGAIGEDNMEKPYFAIPYYFFWGVIVKISFLQATVPLARRTSSRPMPAYSPPASG